MKKILWAILLLFALSVNTFAVEQGAYGVYCGINYYNPDTGEIDDGGTANAALGDGMSRSVTGTTALVEYDGENYYVTLRLLLQSSTYDAQFWTRTGYDSYETVGYEIVAENGLTDSVDYRFAVADPYQPIRASMYVIPMGRETVWYIQLDESSATEDTGEFDQMTASQSQSESATQNGDLAEETQSQSEGQTAQKGTEGESIALDDQNDNRPMMAMGGVLLALALTAAVVLGKKWGKK